MTMLAVAPLWVAVHIPANIFFPVPVSTDVAELRSRGGGTQCTRDFWRGKNPSKQSSIWIFISLCGLCTLALMWYIFYMYNSFKKSTDWQLESSRCSWFEPQLWFASCCSCGWVALGPCPWPSWRLWMEFLIHSCDLGALSRVAPFAPLIWLRCRCR